MDFAKKIGYPCLYLLVLGFVAFLAFYFTRRIENRVNKIETRFEKKKIIVYSSAIAFAFLILTVVAFLPDSESRLELKIAKSLEKQDFTPEMVPADKLADQIVNNYHKINVIDVRDSAAFSAYHLPFAINIPLEKMRDRQWRKILDQKHKTNYFYADDIVIAEKAYITATYLGKADNHILAQSGSEFRRMYTNLVAPGTDAGKNEINTYNFRKKAAADMATLVEALKNSTQPIKVKTSKVKGGC